MGLLSLLQPEAAASFIVFPHARSLLLGLMGSGEQLMQMYDYDSFRVLQEGLALATPLKALSKQKRQMKESSEG